MKDIIRKILQETIKEKELDEKTRTLKNARRVTLYPKSAKKSNPLRFRPELREDRIEYGNNLSPEQLNYVNKYIEKNGKIDWSDLKFAGIDWYKNHRQIYKLLSKRIGSHNDILKKIDERIINKILTIDDCGTYIFNFIVNNYDLEQDADGVYFITDIDCIIDQNGSVILANISDERVTFEKLHIDPNNEYEDVLWELGYEMQDCINSKLTELLTYDTGVDVENVDIRPGKKELFN